MKGRAVSSDHLNASKIPTSVQLPLETADKEVVEREKNPVLEQERTDFGDEYAMVADTSEVEGIEPRSLAKAK